MVLRQNQIFRDTKRHKETRRHGLTGVVSILDLEIANHGRSAPFAGVFFGGLPFAPILHSPSQGCHSGMHFDRDVVTVDKWTPPQLIFDIVLDFLIRLGRRLVIHIQIVLNI